MGHGAVGRGHGVGPGTGHGARGFGTAHAGPRAPALTGDGPSPLAVRREAPPPRGPCVEASPALLRRCSFRHVHPEIFRFSPKKAKCLFFLCFSRGKTVGGGTRKRNCARVERPGEGRDPREPPLPSCAPPRRVQRIGRSRDHVRAWEVPTRSASCAPSRGRGHLRGAPPGPLLQTRSTCPPTRPWGATSRTRRDCCPRASGDSRSPVTYSRVDTRTPSPRRGVGRRLF